MKSTINFIKKIGKSFIYNTERVLIHTKFKAAPLLKHKLLKKNPGEDWLDAYINFRKYGFAQIPSLINENEYRAFQKLDKISILKNIFLLVLL